MFGGVDRDCFVSRIINVQEFRRVSKKVFTIHNLGDFIVSCMHSVIVDSHSTNMTLTDRCDSADMEKGDFIHENK